MHDALIAFTESLPVWLQWAGVMLISAIPFVESYLGTLIGIVAGVPTPLAVAAAVVGNVISMLAFVFLGAGARKKALERRAKGGDSTLEPELSPRQQRFKRMFDRFGVPGVSLLGQWVLPSQLSSGLMVSFGASRNAVIVWQIISIILWGILFAVIGNLGLIALR
ncbi:hypothetical protein GCM10011490_29320 [Pseudoclavibacter endophyticus]|uniref:DedA family protein n=1 Tax=Pseudoclavibacter endophyticus TaxID=1778590 RepID=A0A6H9WL74_9MICO|nr:hypothetical protein [Pseudoclavibacter endophyticus]KAB1646662.1 hypothetical protein F8O04_12975 [Pseudoclavibacter endophyticus]GGA76689.1 hypothetical protein GCM10011490_29320 [Pseudoclavibacter endophyticus]